MIYPNHLTGVVDSNIMKMINSILKIIIYWLYMIIILNIHYISLKIIKIISIFNEILLKNNNELLYTTGNLIENNSIYTIRMYVCGECVDVVNVGDVGVDDEWVGILYAVVCVCVCARACVLCVCCV